jgi:hypothetical protein
MFSDKSSSSSATTQVCATEGLGAARIDPIAPGGL